MSVADDGPQTSDEGSQTERASLCDVAAETSLPRTTAGAILIVTLLGSLAVAFRAPMAGGATFLGAVLGVAVRRGVRGRWTMVVGTAVVPLVAFGLVVTIIELSPSTVPGPVSPILGLVAGVTLVGAVTEFSSSELQWVGWIGLVTGLTVLSAAVVAFVVSMAGGFQSFLGATLWPAGRTASGLFGSTILAALTLAACFRFVPLATITTPQRQPAAKARRTWLVRAAIGVVPASVVVALSLAFLGILNLVVTSGLLRRLLVGVSVVCGTLAVVGFVVGQSWQSAGERTKPIFSWIVESSRDTGYIRNPVVGVLVGVCSGTLLLFVLVSGSVGVTQGVQQLYALIGVSLVASGIFTLAVARSGHLVSIPAPTTLLAGTLWLQAVIVAYSGRSDTVAGLTIDGVSTICTLAAASFVYTAGRYGQTLAHEVGSATTRRPQLVWLGWSGVVGIVGVVVATGLYWFATAFQSVLTGPSRVGVTAGIVALGAVTWLLLRQ